MSTPEGIPPRHGWGVASLYESGVNLKSHDVCLGEISFSAVFQHPAIFINGSLNPIDTKKPVNPSFQAVCFGSSIPDNPLRHLHGNITPSVFDGDIMSR